MLLLTAPMLRRWPLRFPPDAATDALLRSSAPSSRRLTSASSAVMQSMEELIDHAAMGKRQEQEAASADGRLFASPFLHTTLDENARVHPTAVVDARASLGRNVRVGPYSVVGPDVVLEDGVVLQSHGVVEGKTRIGSETIVHPFACIGGEPQDKKHNPQIVPSDAFQLDIGRKCVIREHVTIHGSTSYSAGSPTSLGDNCWILCGAHVGHDVQIGSHVVLSNNVCVAGHVEIGNFAIIGGQVGLKQHIKIGSLAMIGGGSAVDGDVLPYGLASGNRAKLLGLNLIGLRRAKISRHQIKLMLRVVRYLFGSSLTSIAAVCPKTGFAPALDLPHHDSVIMRAFEAKRYLADLEITIETNPFAHEIVDFVLLSPDRPKSSLCNNGNAPEEAALLGARLQTPLEGVANAEPGAESSSPLLVRPDHNIDPSSPQEKAKRKKRKKPRESLSSSTRALRSRSKRKQSANDTDGSSNRNTRTSVSRNDHRQNEREIAEHVPRRPENTPSVWSWLSRCVCVRGSLLLPASITELPELSRDARGKLKSLDRVTKKSNVEMFVRHTDNMPFLSNSISSYGHPIVVIHILDVCTGLPLAPRQHTGQATFRSGMLNAFEWNSSHVCRKLTLQEFLSPQVVILFEIVEPRRRKAHNRMPVQKTKQQVVETPAGAKAKSNDLDYDLSSEAFYKRIGWCFFRPISGRGNVRLPSVALPDKVTAHEGALRLQLFVWHPLSWLDSYQARSQFRWDPESGEGVPSVFLQYQRRTKAHLPCSIHIDIRPVAASQSPKRLNTIAEGASQSVTAVTTEPSTGSNQEDTIDKGGGGIEHAVGNSSAPDPLLQCKRHPSELCLVPQRVLHRLPTGRKGCSCLAFSPDGVFLAAAIHHLTSTADEWVVHIHEINTGVLWQSCRGHQNMIYSLEWGFTADGVTRTVISASSDGSAILWQLRSRASGTVDRSAPPAVLPSHVLQHVPSPVFVYCALFHPKHAQVVVTGASDGVIRLWDAQGTSQSSKNGPARPYSSSPVHEWKVNTQDQHVAIHSIRMETRQGGRLFCGDASGTITVWSPTNIESLRYELTKTVRTGQRSVASLSLHPRKQHLLVLTHPHALFQYETRSFLLLHKNYSGIECDQLLTKAAFSPDGQYVVSGSEDGVPHLFGAVEGVRLSGSSGGLWGHRFFHGFPLMEIAWSPSAHIVAMAAYGEHHPIVVLCANREDRSHVEISGPGMHKQLPDRRFVQSVAKHVELASPDAKQDHRHLRNPVAQVEDPAMGSATERMLHRRQQRLQAKLARELDAAEPQQSAPLSSSAP